MYEVLMTLGLWLAGLTVGSLIGPITVSESIILLITLSLLVYILGKLNRGAK